MRTARGRGSRSGSVPKMWSGVPEDLLVPEAALPSQFDDIWHHSRAISPERSLALAVLSQAIIDLQKNRYAKRRRQQRFFMEAYEWVASDDRSWPFSFTNLCEYLDLPVEPLRRGLTEGTAGERLDEEGRVAA